MYLERGSALYEDSVLLFWHPFYTYPSLSFVFYSKKVVSSVGRAWADWALIINKECLYDVSL